MKHLLFLSCLALCACAAPTTFTGTVRDMQSRDPVVGALVSVEGVENGEIEADGEGHFELQIPGSDEPYTVRVTAAGYPARWAKVVIQGESVVHDFELNVDDEPPTEAPRQDDRSPPDERAQPDPQPDPPEQPRQPDARPDPQPDPEPEGDTKDCPDCEAPVKKSASKCPHCGTVLVD